jgi:hypothetical protein
MNPLSYVRMALWSFFGIRRRAAAGEELTKARPLALVATALALGGTGVLGLLGLAVMAVRVAA